MFGIRLKELRARESMSQTDLAKKLNISQQTVAKWELGSTFPKPSTLVKLTEIFDVSADYLLGIPSKITDHDLIVALFGDDKDISADMLEDVKNFADFIKTHNKSKQ